MLQFQMETVVGEGLEERRRNYRMNIPRSVPAVSEHRRWLDKEFVEYEIAAIVSAAITRDAILSTSDPFTISAIRPKVPGERGARSAG